MNCVTSKHNKGGKTCNPERECPCAPGSKKSISEIIKCYLSDTRGVDKERDYYLSVTPKEALNSAGLALSIWAEGQNKPRKHPHQFRRKPTSLEKAREALLAAETKILACSDFEALHALLDKTIRDIPDIGPLMVYDTALRIGITIGVPPKKVYLHSGTFDGAHALITVGKRLCLEVSDLPKEFHKLDADSIESCLCICKEQFKYLRACGFFNEC